MAADLAHSISQFWLARDNASEQNKWEMERGRHTNLIGWVS